MLQFQQHQFSVFPAVGIEIVEAFCERAARRLDAIPRHMFQDQQLQ